MIKVLIGDMFENKADALVNTVNCEGVMGKGVALEFKKRFPEMFKEYSLKCKNGEIQTGKLTTFKGLFDDQLIINFPTKKHWRSPTLIKDIEEGLNFFVENYKSWNINSVAFPPLGCGNGGLTWDIVGPLMYSKLKDLDINIYIYAPFGTNLEQLKVEFLESNLNVNKKTKGDRLRSMVKENEILVLETLFRLQQRQYAKPVGRVMYQKVCYILTEAGAPTYFNFKENSYGPYSEGAKKSLTILANNNLTHEEKIGKMFKTKVTERYLKLREENTELISKNEEYISKAVDLISRIKDTDQSEEVATVMYAAKTLNIRLNQPPADNEVVDYIFNWKKNWQKDNHRKISLSETVEGLTMMGWINVQLTKTGIV